MNFNNEYCAVNKSISNFSDVCLPEEQLLLQSTENETHTFPCYNIKLFNKTDYTSVMLMNASQLMTHLSSHEAGMCAVALFYASWCPFSIKMALWYNMLGRLIPGLPVLAVQVKSQITTFSVSQLRYGITAVPHLLVFQGHRIVARYNESDPSIHNLIEFLGHYMDLSHYNMTDCCSQSFISSNSSCCAIDFNATDKDYLGPIPVQFESETDWFFMFSCVFLVYIAYSYLKN